jgi:hypothetical protein
MAKTYVYISMTRCGTCALLRELRQEPFQPKNLNAEYIVAIMPNALRHPETSAVLNKGDKILMQIGAMVQVWACPNNSELCFVQDYRCEAFVEPDFARLCKEYKPKE